ncbi:MULTISPECIES: RadC family protein [Paenibacillus]|jgi:DNA repair protein RadC|uniref:JAB domain-containing protein n=1 Tax=Paenibacillus TaxID=44249 RepID=UPI00387A188A
MLNLQSHQGLSQMLSHALSLNKTSVDKLFELYPTAEDILETTPSCLAKYSGLSIHQIKSIKSLLHFMTAPQRTPKLIRTPEHVAELLRSKFAFRNQELFYCLYLNVKNRLIACKQISLGTLNAAVVHPREVFRPAILYAAASVICAHNHPSGNPTPSEEDIAVTQRLQQTGTIIGIDLLDHIIFGNNNYISLKQQGY